MQLTPSTKKWINAIIIAILIACIGFAGCSTNTHSKPYTIRINANTDSGYNPLDSTYSLMDGNRVVSTFKDNKLDSIILNDNQ